MPSPIGHALGGVAVAWSAEWLPNPGKPLRRVSPRLTLICAALAAAPDLDLFDVAMHRTVTHSIGAVILVTIVAAGVTGWVTRRIDWRVAFICGAAYASHLLLDWLGHDPYPPHGIQALWPFSHQWFISPVEIFRGRNATIRCQYAIVTVKAVAQEIAILGPIVLVLGWARRSRVRVEPSS